MAIAIIASFTLRPVSSVLAPWQLSYPKWRVFEGVHISTHIIYAVLTEKALNPFVECASGLLRGEGFSITLKFDCKRSIEHIHLSKNYQA